MEGLGRTPHSVAGGERTRVWPFMRTLRNRPARSFVLILITWLGAAGPLNLLPSTYAAESCTPGPGDTFHCYSIAYESDQGIGYTGISETREIENLNRTGSGWIYSTMWLNFHSNPLNWVEVGTAYGNGGEWDYGYQCDAVFCNFKFFASSQTPPGTRAYEISREESGSLTSYDLKLSGTTVSIATTNWTRGYEVYTGLESYDQNATFPAYTTSSLKYRRWAGAFKPWAGRDGKSSPNPMCGRWNNSDTQYRAAENTTCA